MDPVLPVLSILGYIAIILGSFGGPGILGALRIDVSCLAASDGAIGPKATQS